MITEIEYKRVNQLRAGYERKYTILLRNLLNSQFRKVADSINVTNIGSDAVLSNVSEEPMRKLFENLYKTVGVQFAGQTYRTRKAKDDELIDEWEIYMRDYARTKAGERIVSITSVSKEQIRKIMTAILDQSIEDGLGSEETARLIKKAIKAEGETINTWRALRIARTEVMTASNAGAIEGARSLDVPMEKIWIATLDGRQRDWHGAMNNKAVDFNEDFKLDTGSVMFQPGDPAGLPEDIINCRCTVAFRVKRG